MKMLFSSRERRSRSSSHRMVSLICDVEMMQYRPSNLIKTKFKLGLMLVLLIIYVGL